MGFWNFLKGLLPEQLIKINVRKIIITDNFIQIGNQKIRGSELVGKIFLALEKFKDKESLPCQLIHQDLYNSYEDYEEISIAQKESLNKLRAVLPEEEIECILIARRVKLAYDRKDKKLAKKLHQKLLNLFPGKGAKVYNLIGGGYFDEMIIPFIDVFYSHYGENYIEKFREFYFGIIKFFPLAYFVGNGTTKLQVIEAIDERLKLSIPFIRLHAIGHSNIRKIQQAITDLEIESKYNVKNHEFTRPGGLKALITEIQLQ
jgi:hypothetical protein